MCEDNFDGAVSQMGTVDFSVDDRTALAAHRAGRLSSERVVVFELGAWWVVFKLAGKSVKLR